MSEDSKSTTALVPVSSPRRELTAKELHRSNLYPHIDCVEKAAVIISKARALKIEPSVIAENVYFVGGKPGLSAFLFGVLVKRHEKYDYRCKTKTEEKATIEFRERIDSKWETIGVESFTVDDAKKAELIVSPQKTPSWFKFRPSMLFSRCMTFGVRTHCPDALMGEFAYSIEELNPRASYDEEGRLLNPEQIDDAEICISAAEIAGLEQEIKDCGIGMDAALKFMQVPSLSQCSKDDAEKMADYCKRRKKSNTQKAKTK